MKFLCDAVVFLRYTYTQDVAYVAVIKNAVAPPLLAKRRFPLAGYPDAGVWRGRWIAGVVGDVRQTKL